MKKRQFLLFLSFAVPAFGVDFVFNGGTADWNSAGSWTPAGPPSGGGGNFAYVNTGTATIAADTPSIQDPFIGRGAGNNGTVDQTAGMHANSGWTFIGDRGGTGAWNVTGSGSMTTGRIYLGGARSDAGGPGGGTGSMTVNTSGTVTAGSDFSIGTRGGNGNVTVSGGTLTANTWMIIGETQNGEGGSTGTLVQNGGVVNVGATDANARLWIASQEGAAGAASTGTYTLNNGALNTNNINVGKNYTGFFNQNGGTVTVRGTGDNFLIGDASGSNGTYTMTGGTLNVNGAEVLVAANPGSTGAFNVSGSAVVNMAVNMQVGARSTGTLGMTGGTINNSGWFVVGRYVGGNGTMTMSAGTFAHNTDATGVIIGEEGTGILTLAGTASMTVNSSQGLRVGHTATGNGTINLNGGTLATRFIQKTDGGSTAKLNFDGGTLKALVPSGDFFLGFTPAQIELKTGGLKFDTNGSDVTFTQPLSGAGGLTKLGAGALTLNGISTYAGTTLVSAGSLKLAAGASLNPSSVVDVASGATLDASAAGGLTVPIGQTLKGNGTAVGNVTVLGTLAPGNSIGQLTFTNDLSLGGASAMEIDRTGVPLTADLASTTGTITYGGTLTVTNIGPAPVQGDTFNLFDASTFAGSFTSVTLPPTSGSDFWQNNLLTNGTITFIPEPAATSLCGILLLFALRRRRR